MFRRITSGAEEFASAGRSALGPQGPPAGGRRSGWLGRGAAVPAFQLRHPPAMPNAETIGHVSFAAFVPKFLLAHKTALWPRRNASDRTNSYGTNGARRRRPSADARPARGAALRLRRSRSPRWVSGEETPLQKESGRGARVAPPAALRSGVVSGWAQIWRCHCSFFGVAWIFHMLIFFIFTISINKSDTSW